MISFKSFQTLVFFLLCISLTSTAFARGKAVGTIKEITAAGSHSSIELSNTIVGVNNGETPPGCATDNRRMELGESQKNQLAILLTAQVLGKSISIVGTGFCTIIATREDISFIVFID